MTNSETVQKKTENRSSAPGVRYPKGCPIDGHQGYGCACNPVRVKS